MANSRPILLLRSAASRTLSLPLRRKQKKVEKTKKVEAKEKLGPVQYIPYIPSSLAAETLDFLKTRDRTQGLAKIVLSPAEPQDTYEERERYQRKYEEMRIIRRKYESDEGGRGYRQQERRASLSMWAAVSALPGNLQLEALKRESVAIPHSLKFNEFYKKQMMETELTDLELKQLQAYQNLMYIRFPYSELRRKSPGLFWARRGAVLSRQQEGAMQQKRAARKLKT